MSAAEINAYMNRQVNRDRRVANGRYGNTPLDGPLHIPGGIREYDGRATRLICAERPTEWAPVNITNHDGLYLRDLELADLTPTQKGKGRPALYVANSRRVTLSNVRISGFGKSAVFRNCDEITLNDCWFDRSAWWNVLFDGCTRVTVNGGGSSHGWLDGYKLANTHHWVFNHVTAIGNGQTDDPTSNGNGIDTYTGSSFGLVNGGTWSDHNGAAINIKTGPKDFGKPSHDITIRDIFGAGNSGAIVDVNSMAAISKHQPGDPEPRSPYNITIDGVRGKGNARTVRVGHGENVLFDGLWSHDGEVYVTDESTVIQRQHEVKP